jgi:hypothetical protein
MALSVVTSNWQGFFDAGILQAHSLNVNENLQACVIYFDRMLTLLYYAVCKHTDRVCEVLA